MLTRDLRPGLPPAGRQHKISIFPSISLPPHLIFKLRFTQLPPYFVGALCFWIKDLQNDSTCEQNTVPTRLPGEDDLPGSSKPVGLVSPQHLSETGASLLPGESARCRCPHTSDITAHLLLRPCHSPALALPRAHQLSEVRQRRGLHRHAMTAHQRSLPNASVQPGNWLDVTTSSEGEIEEPCVYMRNMETCLPLETPHGLLFFFQTSQPIVRSNLKERLFWIAE